MDIEAKKNMLLNMLAAIDDEKIIEHLITITWAKEIEPPEPVKSIPLVPPNKKKGARGPRKSVTIHGIEYATLRNAVMIGYGMEEKDYNRIYRQHYDRHISLEDLLPPRKSPPKTILRTDKHGVTTL